MLLLENKHFSMRFSNFDARFYRGHIILPLSGRDILETSIALCGGLGWGGGPVMTKKYIIHPSLCRDRERKKLNRSDQKCR